MTVSAWAAPTPSFLGPTGLFLVPTADVVGMGEVSAGIALDRSGEDDVSWISVNAGVLPQLEIGATRQKFEGFEADTLLNVKYRLLKPALIATTLSVGMIDVTDQSERSAYAVLTHEVGAGIVMRRGLFSNPRLHVGVGGGELNGVFAGGEITFDGKVNLIAEYDSHDMNFGARVPLAKGFEATVAALENFNDLGVGVAFTSPW
jgi:hypothetical protein